MNDLIYSFEEIRSIDLATVNGGAFMDSFQALINIRGLSFEQVQEMRRMIEAFCRGEE